MRVGVMLCGVLGCTASTLVYGYHKNKNNKDSFRQGSMWCSIKGDFLPEVYNIVFSGWDVNSMSLAEVVKKYGIIDYSDKIDINIYQAIVGSLDYAHRVEGVPMSHVSIEDAISKAKHDINEFRTQNMLDKVIVINFSSPMYCGPQKLKGWSSTTAYSIATIESGADWVEFTPSNSISSELVNLSIKSRSRIAGRDGSTGQTILKLLFKDFLLNKNFIIDGWYSTNLIGNNDGKVLAHGDYNVEKILDKKAVLDNTINDLDNHIVEISYYKPAGDNKESWDCVDFSGWLGNKMSLRLNWHGRDSILAASLALDIITCLIKCEKTNYPYGIVDELAICFKNPVNTDSNSYFEQFQNFRKFVSN